MSENTPKSAVDCLKGVSCLTADDFWRAVFQIERHVAAQVREAEIAIVDKMLTVIQAMQRPVKKASEPQTPVDTELKQATECG